MSFEIRACLPVLFFAEIPMPFARSKISSYPFRGLLHEFGLIDCPDRGLSAVGTTSCDPSAVWTERHIQHCIVVVHAAHLPTCVGMEYSRTTVVTPSRNPGPVRAEYSCPHRVVVVHAAYFGAVFCVEYSRAVVVAARGYPGPVRAERHIQYCILVVDAPYFGASCCVEYSRAVVVAARGYPGPVRAERNCLHASSAHHRVAWAARVVCPTRARPG